VASHTQECFFDKSKKNYDLQAEAELGTPEISLEEDSEQDNEHEESSDADKCADSDIDDSSTNKGNLFPTGIDLQSVDWERFYSTGELKKNTESSAKINVQDVENHHQGERKSQLWKKRLVLN
jgi:hypothetical protein